MIRNTGTISCHARNFKTRRCLSYSTTPALSYGWSLLEDGSHRHPSNLSDDTLPGRWRNEWGNHRRLKIKCHFSFMMKAWFDWIHQFPPSPLLGISYHSRNGHNKWGTCSMQESEGTLRSGIKILRLPLIVTLRYVIN